jgi:hypothetical protein
MANHYYTIVMPAYVSSPKDKPSVEGSVGGISTWIIAAFRNTDCFSIEELNEEVRKKLEEFNHRPFTRKEGCRYSAFEEEEKFELSPLPDMPYKISEWRTAKVRPDYHIYVESMFYSVPYEYINRQVVVKLTDDMVDSGRYQLSGTICPPLHVKFSGLKTIVPYHLAKRHNFNHIPNYPFYK